MVTLVVQIELPPERVASVLMAWHQLTVEEGWRINSHVSTPVCHECGGQMKWDSNLAAHVCHHGAD